MSAVEAFAPQLILVSCGFDASAFDPLAHMMLTSKFFGDVWVPSCAIEWLQDEEADDSCGQGVRWQGGHVPRGGVLRGDGAFLRAEGPGGPVWYCRWGLTPEGIDTKVVNPFDGEIEAYSYHQLQQHQDNVIKEAEELVRKYIMKQ